MKHLKLKHGYHDARINAIRYRSNEDIVLDVSLCSCCNPSPGPATLTFFGVRNFAEIQEVLESSREKNKRATRPYIDEIVDVLRDGERGYILDFATSGDIRVDARAVHEA